MDELKRIYCVEFRKAWDRAYDDWFGKFRLHAKKPLKQYNDGYGTRVFDPIEYFWCHIWSGPHCVYGRTELIPGVTIVTGTNTSPMFFTPKQVVDGFEFADCSPFTGRYVPAGSTYWNRLRDIKESIRKNAEQ